MKRFVFVKLILFIVFGLIFIFINFTNANEIKCSPVGYSILTINGIFTNKEEAAQNKRTLEDKLDKSFRNQPLTVDYLHNPSHFAGAGDLLKVVYQKIFEYETVKDYDMVEMLKDASEKVKTQKLLLVAHSQGNFYANSFYDTVAGKTGGVPKESIGVYSVATPAARVAGEGQWLTSGTDKVIAGLMANFPFKNIMTPNTSIVLSESDDDMGHNFSSVYLKHRGSKIVSDIQLALERLTSNDTQNEKEICLDPPKITLAHKAAGAMFVVSDFAADTAVDSAKFAAEKTYQAATIAVESAKQVAAAAGNLIGFYSALAPKPEENKLSENQNQGVTIITKTEIVSIATPILTSNVDRNDFQQKLADIEKSLNEISRQAAEIKETETVEENNQSSAIIHEMVNEQPRLLFVGPPYPGFGGGGSSAPQIFSSPTTETEEVGGQESFSLSAPSLSIPQCDYSLATDDCLLATTTINFFWPAVDGADYYVLSKNGEFGTTTELSFIATVSDFSDYIFSISSVSMATTSATSTATISIATIPIAINEVAWMGTAASPYDEWMEIKNNTGHPIDLSQWAIEAADGGPYITLTGNIEPYQYIVLERTDDLTTSINAHIVYSGSLNNSGEEIFLYHSSTTLDRTPFGSWPAGDNASSTARKTMERISSKESGAIPSNWATWGTNVNFIKNGADADSNTISGTPGRCNSASFININDGQPIYQDTMLEANGCYYISSGVSVSATSTLAIEEGAQISLYLNNLVINGVLDANGEEDNPVVFDSFSGEATTNKIKINNNGTSTMDNVNLTDTGGIKLDNRAVLEINGAEFENNNTGIELNNSSALVVENANFANTTNEAITAYNGSNVSVASTIITNNEKDAIGIYDSDFFIASSTISGVSSGDGMGLYDSTSTISSITVEDVSNDGIGIYGGTVNITSTTVDNFGNDGVGVYSSANVSGSAVIDGVEVLF